MSVHNITLDSTIYGEDASYHLEENTNTVHITYANALAEGSSSLMMVRTANDNRWWGKPIDWRSINAGFGFQSFLPLNPSNLQVNIPTTGVDSFRTEISWIEEGEAVATLVGIYDNETDIECLLPEGGDGVLIRTTLYGESIYTSQQYFPEWPGTIDVERILEIEDLALEYPNLKVRSNLGELAFLYGTHIQNNTFLRRFTIVPIDNGQITYPLSAMSPMVNDKMSVTEEHYERCFTTSPEASIYYYPRHNERYEDLIASVFQIADNQTDWLFGQVYEVVRVQL